MSNPDASSTTTAERTRTPKKLRIACFMSNLEGGGAEKVAVNLLEGLVSKEVDLDLILADASGPYLSQVPEQVRVIDLGVGNVSKAVLPLRRYLREYKPDALLSHLSHTNVALILAKELSRIRTNLVLVEHNTFSSVFGRGDGTGNLRQRLVPVFVKASYGRADTIIGVSSGVSSDLERSLGLPEGSVRTIYNPVVGETLKARSREPLDHPWFAEDAPPVFLAVGRLSEQKDFATLLQAFSKVRQQADARLVILGEGGKRGELETLRDTLNLSEHVLMPGFVSNPYAYMRRASALVLSSRWEGLPTVLIEAMACGCPVVATDCPSGSKEILEDGRWGPLVPVGDADALAEGMVQVLRDPIDEAALVERADTFSHEAATEAYFEVLLPQAAV